MRFLVDANLSPRVAIALRQTEHDAVAVRDVGLASAPDDEILDLAAHDDRVIISHDTDFGALVAYRGGTTPSFILIRSADPLPPEQQARLIIDNLPAIADDLANGAIAVFARGHLRVRPLPIL